MKCLARFAYTRNECPYPAKFLVTRMGEPEWVCGYHARAYLKSALIPLKMFPKAMRDLKQPGVVDLFKRIVGFAREMNAMGFNISVKDRVIVFQMRGEDNGR